MKTAEDIKAFLVKRISEITETPAEAISTSSPFYRMDIDSMTLVALATELEAFLGRNIESDVMFAASNIDELIPALTESNER